MPRWLTGPPVQTEDFPRPQYGVVELGYDRLGHSEPYTAVPTDQRKHSSCRNVPSLGGNLTAGAEDEGDFRGGEHMYRGGENNSTGDLKPMNGRFCLTGDHRHRKLGLCVGTMARRDNLSRDHAPVDARDSSPQQIPTECTVRERWKRRRISAQKHKAARPLKRPCARPKKPYARGVGGRLERTGCVGGRREHGKERMTRIR